MIAKVCSAILFSVNLLQGDSNVVNLMFNGEPTCEFAVNSERIPYLRDGQPDFFRKAPN